VLAALLLRRDVWWIVPLLSLFGACSAPLTIWAQTLRMRLIPDAMRGRVFALLRTLMQSTGPLASGIGGIVLSVIGPIAAIALASSLVGGPGALGWSLSALRSAGAAETEPHARQRGA
jgi:hypothetical protein